MRLLPHAFSRKEAMYTMLMHRMVLPLVFCGVFVAALALHGSALAKAETTNSVASYRTNLILRTRARAAAVSSRSGTRTVRRRVSSRPRYVPPVRTSSSSSRSSSVANTTAMEKMDEVWQLVNAERAKKGLPALKRNLKLDAAARAHAKDMVIREYFDHVNLDGETPKDRIGKTGYMNVTIQSCDCSSLRYATGENIAKGQKTAAQVVQNWMASPPHREAILSSTFAEIGIGIWGDVWVQTFGSIIITK